ncbi:MAG: SEC-C domain-containing protein [Verrucomicrobiota bacterium]
MNQSGKKVGRNERCHCGSGRKYKHCHLALDQRRNSAAGPVPQGSESSSGAAKMAQLPDYLKYLSRKGPAKDRARFTELLAKTAPILAYVERQEEIEAASEALEAHRAEFEKFSTDKEAYLDRARALFAEECFAPSRFTAADIRRAFDQVGYPANEFPDDRMLETLRAAILYLADKDYRTCGSMNLQLQLPNFVTAGRHLDAWLIQHCAHGTAEFENESNPFLFAMFSYGHKAWIEEKRVHDESLMREFGLTPERVSGMGLEEIDAWIQAQGSDRSQVARMEAFLQKHPDLRSEAIANLEALERDSVKLLGHPDARFLHLLPEEVRPWLETLSQRYENTPQMTPKIQDTALPETVASQMFNEVILPLVREMAQSIFTPDRIQQLLAQLKRYRSEQFAAGDKAIAACATGAIRLVEQQKDPGRNYFLVALCLNSVKSTVDSFSPA